MTHQTSIHVVVCCFQWWVPGKSAASTWEAECRDALPFSSPVRRVCWGQGHAGMNQGDKKCTLLFLEICRILTLCVGQSLLHSSSSCSNSAKNSSSQSCSSGKVSWPRAWLGRALNCTSQIASFLVTDSCESQVRETCSLQLGRITFLQLGRITFSRLT